MKGNKLAKFLPLIVALVSVIGAVLFVRVFMAGEDSIKTDPAVQASVVNPLITFSMWLLYAAIAITLVLAILSLIKNPAALKKTLLGLAVLGVLLLVSYFLSSDAAVYDVQGVLLKDGQAGATSKWVGTGIIYSLILGGIGLFFFVIDLVKGLIKS
ncbi:hypothetical protein C7447_101722 [Tenacibaculum adriaticum]|uniref:Uncharacterized protein n=1 Tax=Tenacibaculum adriaticum TaxID=413713 RepID=A0A5S5DZE8_9FLAO|nr:hypothetical protein [Tenacibaculum adriaticum]TYQ00113.1 hypothetical protein C7447_101722 [Tenacibaculum adriaticum]